MAKRQKKKKRERLCMWARERAALAFSMRSRINTACPALRQASKGARAAAAEEQGGGGDAWRTAGAGGGRRAARLGVAAWRLASSLNGASLIPLICAPLRFSDAAAQAW